MVSGIDSCDGCEASSDTIAPEAGGAVTLSKSESGTSTRSADGGISFRTSPKIVEY